MRGLYEDLHAWVAGAHLVDQLGVCGDDGVGRDVVPHVVGTEMHQNDGGLGGREPADELVLVRDVGDEEAAVAFVFAVVGNTAALCWERADHVEAGFAGFGELVPEECAPAALRNALVRMSGYKGGGGWLTGDPVMLSPRGMIRAAASTGATKVLRAPMRAKTTVEVRMNIFAGARLGPEVNLGGSEPKRCSSTFLYKNFRTREREEEPSVQVPSVRGRGFFPRIVICLWWGTTVPGESQR